MKKALIALLVLFSTNHFAQQRIFGEFPREAFVDDFNENAGKWPTITTTENYYVVDSGEYYMNRNNPVAPYIVMANYKNELNVFHIATKIKMGPSDNDQSSVGIACMVQTEKNSALIFEFNQKQRFRIVKIKDGQLVPLSNTRDGWEKSSQLKGINEFNLLEIKSAKGDYDFYINGGLVASLYDGEFSYGNMGFFLGPETKARADYFYVRTTPPSPEELARSACEEEMEQLRKENEALKKELSQRMDEQIVELQGVIRLLESQLAETTEENERLKKEIIQYEEIRYLVGNIDRDLLLTLSRNLKSEIEKNNQLSRENYQLKDSIARLNEQYREFQTQVLDKILSGEYLIEGENMPSNSSSQPEIPKEENSTPVVPKPIQREKPKKND